MVLYKGCCHCGRHRFTLERPPMTVATACNCSICDAGQLLWAFLDDEEVNFQVVSADGDLVAYESQVMRKEFCANCGTCVKGFHKIGALEGKPAINVRTLLHVNPWTLQHRKALERLDDTPEHSFQGTLPTDPTDDDAQVYTGGCHCGRVGIAVKSKPLENVEIKEDNCSICVRLACTQIYSHQSQVSITGEDAMTTYRYGRGFNGAPFCATCGSYVFGKLYGPPQEVVDKLPPEKQEFVQRQLEVVPVNLRALNDVDWGSVNVVQSDEGTDGYALNEGW